MNKRRTIVGREVVAVILQHFQVECFNSSVGGVSYCHINPFVPERLIHQGGVHLHYRHIEPVFPGQVGVPIRALQELRRHADTERSSTEEPGNRPRYDKQQQQQAGITQRFGQRLNMLFQPAQQAVKKQCQCGGGKGTGQYHGGVVQGDAAEDKLPESSGAYQGTERRHPHIDHRRRTDPGKDHRHRQRQLHLCENLAVGHPHPAGRFHHRGFHLVDAGISVSDDGKQRI